MDKKEMRIILGLDDSGLFDVQLYVQGFDVIQFSTPSLQQILNITRLMKVTYRLTISFSPTLSAINHELFARVKEVLGRG